MRQRTLPTSFYEIWALIPTTQWDLRQRFEDFYNAGMSESDGVLRDLYIEAADKMTFSPELHERIKYVLGVK